MLAAQEAERRSEYSTRQASIDDLFATVEFGRRGSHNPIAEAGLRQIKEESTGKLSVPGLPLVLLKITSMNYTFLKAKLPIHLIWDTVVYH